MILGPGIRTVFSGVLKTTISVPVTLDYLKEFPCFRASGILALAFSFSVRELLSMDFKRMEGKLKPLETLNPRLNPNPALRPSVGRRDAASMDAR